MFVKANSVLEFGKGMASAVPPSPEKYSALAAEASSISEAKLDQSEVGTHIAVRIRNAQESPPHDYTSDFASSRIAD